MTTSGTPVEVPKVEKKKAYEPLPLPTPFQNS